MNDLWCPVAQLLTQTEVSSQQKKSESVYVYLTTIVLTAPIETPSRGSSKITTPTGFETYILFWTWTDTSKMYLPEHLFQERSAEPEKNR